MIPASALIAAFDGYLAAKDGYIPNTAGELWTAEKQAKAANETVKKYGSQWIGHRVEDCSGAFVRAYKAHGLSIYHGSNRIARVYVRQLLPISEAKPGMAAFKRRLPGAEYYDLPSEYKPGGRYYNGDLADYYHVGLVAEDPRSVINAQGTQAGVVKSWISYGWHAVAYLKDVQYNEKQEGEDEKMGNAVIVSANGGPVNLRQAPSKQAALVNRLSAGTPVDVVKTVTAEDGSEWCYITSMRGSGYVMAQFVEGAAEAADPDPDAPDPDAGFDPHEAALMIYGIQERLNQAQELLSQLQAQMTGAVG